MDKQVAILIDGDNIASKYAEYIKQEAMNYGNVKVFRLYGSVTSPTVKSWYKVMPLQGIMPMLQISYVNGKSIADQAMTIDTMDLLYSNELDVFCIVSSDSDFTKLVYRLKESGKIVIGMGEKKTNEALAKACDEFKILDLIYKDAKEEPAQNKPASVNPPKIEEPVVEPEIIDSDMEEIESIEETEISIPTEGEILDYITDFIDSTDDDRINLSEVGSGLKQKYLGFDPRNYGYRNMTKMVEKHSNRFKVDKEIAQDGMHKVIYIMERRTKNK